MLLNIIRTKILLLLLAGAVCAQAPPARADHVLFLSLLPHGFHQSSVTIPMGKIQFVFKNRSYIDVVQLRLDRLNGAQVQGVALPKGKRAWREVIELAPGQYTLTVAGDPKWRCNILVTQKR